MPISDTDRPPRRNPPSEFSRPFSLERLGPEPQTLSLEASAAEREALARRFDLLRLDALTADLTVAWTRGRRVVEVRGRLRGKGVQRCVVTLAPVDGSVDEPFVQRYILGEAKQDTRAIELDPGGEDPPEPVGLEGIDLGEAVAQEFSLALDPYPRAPDAAPDPEAQDWRSDPDAIASPFAVLKVLQEPASE